MKNIIQKFNKIKFFFLFMLIPVFFSAQTGFNSNQVYSLETKSTGRFLRVQNGSNATVEYNNNDSMWKFEFINNNVYKLKNTVNSKVLRASASSSDITLESESGVIYEQWEIVKHSSGYYRIKNLGTNLYATAQNENGTWDSNPDIRYFNSYSKIGDCTQNQFQSVNRQLWHIAPIKISNSEALAVPQLGWLPSRPKRAILVRNSDITAPSYVLKKVSDSQIVASGTFQKWDGSNKTLNQYYYVADIDYNVSGNYILESDNKSVSVLIAEDIYQNPRATKNGNIGLTDVFDGFWKYNRFYTPDAQTIPKTDMILTNGYKAFPGLSNGESYTVSPFGWYDAHSRDSKIGRSAKVIADLCYAFMESNNTTDKTILSEQIEYGTKHLIDNQLQDGSWEAGRIRDSSNGGDFKFYYWVTNIDVNTVARCVKALALVNQIFSNSNSTLASDALSSAQLGWGFVSSNENLVDPYINFSYKGDASDVLAAAIEMAYATNNSQFFNKADQMIMEATYSQGAFKKISGSFPGQLNNAYQELDNGTIISICRYLNIASSSGVIDKTNLLLTDFVDYWTNRSGGILSPHGFPQHIIGRPSNFGNLTNVGRFAYAMMAVWSYTQNETALKYAEGAFNLLTGLNSFQTSYIVGYGDPAIAQSVNYFKRSFEDGIGSILPGWYTTTQGSDTVLVQTRHEYQNTEGVSPTSSVLFYLLAAFNNMSNTDCSLLESTNIVSTDSNCSFDDGSITFTFNDAPARQFISFSIDGGLSYTNVLDDSQTYSFNNLSSGDYDVFIRWGNGSCTKNVGIVSIECNDIVFLTNKQYPSQNLRATNSFGSLSLQNLEDIQEQWQIVPAEGEWFYLENVGFNNERLRAVNNNGSFNLVNKETSTGYHVQWREIDIPGDPDYFYLENRMFSERLKSLDLSTFDLTLDVGPRVRWTKSSTVSGTNKSVLNKNDVLTPESDVNDIIIYISPADENTLHIRGFKEITKVSVYNMLGQLVKTDQVSNQLDISHIKSGIYIFVVDYQKKVIKFVKR